MCVDCHWTVSRVAGADPPYEPQTRYGSTFVFATTLVQDKVSNSARYQLARLSSSMLLHTAVRSSAPQYLAVNLPRPSAPSLDAALLTTQPPSPTPLLVFLVFTTTSQLTLNSCAELEVRVNVLNPKSPLHA